MKGIPNKLIVAMASVGSKDKQRNERTIGYNRIVVSYIS